MIQLDNKKYLYQIICGYIMKKIKLKSSSIRFRILLITISTVVCISIAILFAGYQTVSKDLQTNMIQTSEMRVSFLCNSINTNLANFNSFVRTCQGNRKIIAFAMEDNQSDIITKRDAHDFILENYQANKDISQNLVRVVIMGNKRNDIIQIVEAHNSTTSVSRKGVESLPYFSKISDTKKKESVGILSDPFFTTRSVPMIPFAYPIYHPFEDEIIGYVFAELSTKTITSPIDYNMKDSSSNIYFKIDEHLYLYKNGILVPFRNTFSEIDNLNEYALNYKTSISRSFNNETSEICFMISRPLDIDGWYIIESINTQELTRNIENSYNIMLLFILIVGCIVTIVLYWFLYNTVAVPVYKLQKRIKKIEKGDFSRDPSIEWEHELGDIGKTINNLTETVQKMLTQKVEDEKKKNEYEYKMLQSQINPHFLYNTLNSIKWMATIQNAPGIAEMTTALSRLLKNVSKGTSSTISIKNELDLVNDYFTIQKYRYGGTITMNVSYDDPDLLSYEILRFTLQPIVENAIFHGIEPKGTAGTIEIHIFSDENDDIHIDVTDDGVGLDEESMSSILNDTNTSSTFFKEIGISNVNKRIQYNYGEKYGLFIHSELGEYTTITVLLPKKKCEDVL